MEKAKALLQPHSLSRALLIIFAFWIFSWSINGIRFSYDSWSHLSIGRYIIENLNIPRTFVFSYSLPQKEWVNYEWLFQVIFYQIFRIFSYKGVLVFGALLITATFFLVSLHRPFREKTSGRKIEDWHDLRDSFNKRVIIPFMVVMVAFLVIEPRLTLRPHLFEYLFLASFLLILLRYHTSKKSFVILPLIQILWINIHASAILCPLVILACLIGGVIDNSINKEQKTKGWNDLRKLIVLFILVSLSTLINPYTYKIFYVPYESIAFYLKNPDIQPLFVERQNIFTASPFREIISCMTLLLLSGYSFVKLRKKQRLSDLLIYFLFILLLLQGRRFTGEFAIASSIFFLENMRRYEEKKTVEKTGGAFPKSSAISAIKLIPSVLFFFLLFVPNIHSGWNMKSDRSPLPVKAVEFTEQTNLKGNLFNSLEIGGYLIWRTFPKRQVFYCDAQGFPDFLPTFIRAHVDPNSWNALEQRYGFNYALVAIKDRFDKHLSEKKGWYLVYWDNSFLLYVKKDGRNDEAIKKYGYNWIRPNQSLSYLDGYLKNPDSVSMAIKESQRTLRLNPDFKEGYSSLGYIYLKLGDLDSSLKEYLSLLSIDPRNISALTNIGVIKARQGRLKEAIEYWKRVIEADSRNSTVLQNIQKAENLLGDRS
ncbi:MAG: tetratricopeptide repeat protein [Desulfobacterales bacterium]|nr:tetratricopeptide repeat protein [Desulfobacterales bacterium]